MPGTQGRERGPADKPPASGRSGRPRHRAGAGIAGDPDDREDVIRMVADVERVKGDENDAVGSIVRLFDAFEFSTPLTGVSGRRLSAGGRRSSVLRSTAGRS